MKKELLFLCLSAFLIFIFTPVSMFAQDVDISGMDNAQLMTLLQDILSKLQSEDKLEETATETIIQTEEPNLPTAAETDKITVYLNKKLIIESLPGYMFIQPKPEEKNNDPNPGDPSKKKRRLAGSLRR